MLFWLSAFDFAVSDIPPFNCSVPFATKVTEFVVKAPSPHKRFAPAQGKNHTDQILIFIRSTMKTRPHPLKILYLYVVL
jgi:hypothetical protein